MVYIRTNAYNAEKTIRRTIRSVLSQTYCDFIWYLCDNGSTDGTGDIIQEYAIKDLRIKHSRNEINHDFTGNEEFIDLPLNIGYEDVFTIIDADDEFMPAFLEESLGFMHENNLDIVITNSMFINEITGKITGYRAELQKNLILYERTITDNFSNCFCFYRALWAKLYKGKVFHPWFTQEEKLRIPAYGSDTFIVIKSLSNANRLGILAKPLYKYYISPKSVSHIFKTDRLTDNKKMYNQVFEYLRNINGLTNKNVFFIMLCWFNDLNDTVNVILNADLTFDVKIDYIYQVFDVSETMQAMISQRNTNFENQKLRLINIIIGNINRAYKSFIAKNKVNLTEKYNKLLQLLEFYRDFKYYDIPEQLKEFCNVKFCYHFKNIMTLIMDKNYNIALEELKNINEKSVDEHELIAFYLLGETLSAVNEDMDSFINYKKKRIVKHIVDKDFKQAEIVLENYDEVIPKDEEFKQFRDIISEIQY